MNAAGAAMGENEIGTIVLDEAILIHRELGPGLLESVLKLTGLKLGYLINFGEALLKNGITRTANGLAA